MAIQYIKNPFQVKEVEKSLRMELTNPFSYEVSKDAARYHSTFKQYGKTPFYNLEALADYLELGNIYVKDESGRFGLNAFKVLGSSYAVGRYVAEKLGLDFSKLSYNQLISEEVKTALGEITFVTATDGNHGRGVAWTARELSKKCVVYMPKGTAISRIKNIERLGAEVIVTDKNHNDCVLLAKEYAKNNNGLLIQDTAWDGYEDIPLYIMQGYTTILNEIDSQLKTANLEKPTHIILQAGVGSLAAAVEAYYASIYEEIPKMIIVEPAVADCFFQSAVDGSGKRITVSGEMQSLMAGLACGEINPISWEIIKCFTDSFITCQDDITANGIRILANPLAEDKKIISGESGAVGAGLLYAIMKQKNRYRLKEQLGLDKNARVLLISTEGATDPDAYRQITWLGKNTKKQLR